MGRDDESTWTELVASFNAPTADVDRTWPEAEDVDPDKPESTYDSSATTTNPGLSYPSAGGPSHDVAAAEQTATGSDQDHFVPPTPPPFPRSDMITMLAWFGVFGSPVLFAGAYVFNYYIAPLISFVAAIAFLGGFALLISRLKGHDPHDPDNGAVV